MFLTLTSRPFSCPDKKIDSHLSAAPCMPSIMTACLNYCTEPPCFSVLMAFMIYFLQSIQNSIFKTKLDQVTLLRGGNHKMLYTAPRLKFNPLLCPQTPYGLDPSQFSNFTMLTLFLLLYSLEQGKLQPIGQIHPSPVFSNKVLLELSLWD